MDLKFNKNEDHNKLKVSELKERLAKVSKKAAAIKRLKNNTAKTSLLPENASIT